MKGIPPGLEGQLVEFKSGGDENWNECPPFKHFTNAFVVHKGSGKLLLGMKKRGFGLGMYNGFGGKVEPGETPSEAAIRELKEESGLDCELEPCGILLFVISDYEYSYYIHVYRTEHFQNEPIETEEMKPEWFAIPEEYLSPAVAQDKSLPDIPYDKMWADDKFWLPMLITGRKFVGRADFKRQGSKETEWVMERWWFGKEAS